jgi:hypothetical protein
MTTVMLLPSMHSGRIRDEADNHRVGDDAMGRPKLTELEEGGGSVKAQKEVYHKNNKKW